MSQLVTIDAIREIATHEDVGLWRFHDSYLRRLNHRLGKFKARVFSRGSTHPKRRTAILDPAHSCKAYPPDLDFSVVILGNKIPSELEEIIFEDFEEHGHVHQHERDGKLVGVYAEGNYLVTVQVYTSASTRFFCYSDVIDSFTDTQRVEARTLKILLQRYGCYGGHNRAFHGIVVDELIRQHGTVGKILNFLYGCANKSVTRSLIVSGTTENLLQGISSAVWKRTADLARVEHNRDGFKDMGFYQNDWKQIHSSDATYTGVIQCSAGRCGREDYTVARMVREFLKEFMLEHSIKHGEDYHVIPCQGDEKIGPHTHIYLSVPAGEKLSVLTVDLEQKTKQKIIEYINE